MTHKYTTVCYCGCYINGKGCSEMCKCKNCHNAFGHSQKVVASVPPPKKRPKHAWQQHTPSSAEFAYQAGEDISHGPRTSLEFFPWSSPYVTVYNKEFRPQQTTLLSYTRQCRLLSQQQNSHYPCEI